MGCQVSASPPVESSVVVQVTKSNQIIHRFTGFPILLALLCLLFKLKCMVTNEDFPKYDKTELYRGMTLLGIAVGCFIRGLDDATDPYRFFHGTSSDRIGSFARTSIQSRAHSILSRVLAFFHRRGRVL